MTEILERNYKLIMSVSVLVLFCSVYYYFTPSNKNSFNGIKTGITERDFLFASLDKSNKQDFNYESAFTPGIGYIADPKSFKDNWEKDTRDELLKKQINN